jgi:hypothetical protein
MQYPISDECEETTNPTKLKCFHAKRFHFTYSEQGNECLKYERYLLGTKVKLNPAYQIKFDLILVNFIYNYNFAKLIDHVLNIRKCLFVMHSWDLSNGENNEKPLSADFLLCVKKFQLIIEDDPFEVKLAYNYALMVDEHFESIKRHETLNQRRAIKEKGLEKEAKDLMKQKEATIYVKRSQMVYRNVKPIRKQLFCFQVDHLDLYALADIEWHGRDKCYEILRQIDKASAPPPLLQPSIGNQADQYSILWCRHINLTFGDFQFLFRDYTQPLLKMNKLSLFGKLLGAEYGPHSRSKRDINVNVFSGWEKFHVQRSLSPFKLYHDVCSNIDLFSFAYGPCWEGLL